MSIDWRAHYDAIYSTLGVTATITLAETGDQVSVIAIDKTDGIQIGADASVASVKPAAAVRLYDFAEGGFSRDDLGAGATIELNGATWRVEGTLPRPSPGGEADGEIYLLLSESFD